MAYLFAAYMILWAITFGYVFSIAARQKRLQRELELLCKRHDARSDPPAPFPVESSQS